MKCKNCDENLSEEDIFRGACPHCREVFELSSPNTEPTENLDVESQPPKTTEPNDTVKQKEPLAGKFIAGIAGGFILAVLAVNIFSLFFGDFTQEEPTDTLAALGAILFLGLWVFGIIAGIKSSRPAKAWRRLLIPCGILSLALPLAALVTTGRMASSAASKGGQMAEFEAAATAVGGTFAAGIIGFFGFFLAAIFLTIGFIVGKD